MNFKNWLFSRNSEKNGLPAAISEEEKYRQSDISVWKDIYCGGGEWRYVSKGGLNNGIRRMDCINAAKALCAELSELCLCEGAEFETGNINTATFLRKVLDENNFSVCFPSFTEKMFALGGGVIKVGASGGRIRLDYIDAEHFVPIHYDEKFIYSGIIFSETKKNGINYILAEYHEKTEWGYVVTNRLYKARADNLRYSEIPLAEIYPSLAEKTEIRGLENPLFVYFRPFCANPDGRASIGVSVFAGCTDTLKSLDIVFDSLELEFVLGKKRIIVPVSAIHGTYDESGKLKRYFDTNDEVYQALSANDNEELKITDNSSVLRVAEHREAIAQLLDILCMQTGLSGGALSLHNGEPKTAAEVISRDSKTHRTKLAHRLLMHDGLVRVAQLVLMLGAQLGNISEADYLQSVPDVTFGDGIAQAD